MPSPLPNRRSRFWLVRSFCRLPTGEDYRLESRRPNREALLPGGELVGRVRLEAGRRRALDDRDRIVGLQDVGAELGRLGAVDPHLDAATVAADALRVESHAPHVEHVLEVGAIALLIGLDVDHAG